MSKQGWAIFGGVLGMIIGGAYVLSQDRKNILEDEHENNYREDASEEQAPKAEPTPPLIDYINTQEQCIYENYATGILVKFPKRGEIILEDINSMIKKHIDVPHMMKLINMVINLGLTTDILETEYLKLERECLNI